MMLASLRGDQAEAAPLIEATVAQATTGGQGIAVAYAHWVAAILANGLARYDEALAAARHACEDTFTLYISMWALPELVEAAARTGNTHVAAWHAGPAGGDDPGRRDRLRAGPGARCRALLSGGAAADELYHEAIDRLGRTRLRPELARAHLLYGEWLRREGRRVDARGQLRTAHDMLAAIGVKAFAERAPGADRPARRCRSSASRRTTGSLRRRSRSPGWPATAAPARRSAPSCSCPRARSNGTWARCSPSWASAPAVSCRPRWQARDRTDQPA